MWIDSLWIALSTYSVIPVPQHRWGEQASRCAICFFPVVGLFCGAAQGLWLLFCETFSVGELLYAAVAAVVPLLITGGIHMDGYMDTVDALASWQPRERRLEIMKDSHCGSFAVLYCGGYLLVSAGLFAELYSRKLVLPVLGGYVLSRALSGICALNLPSARKTGMLASMTGGTRRRSATIALVLTAAVSGGVVLLQAPAAAVGGMLLAALWVGGYCRLTTVQFGGVTGDTAGFFLQVCELVWLVGVLLGGMLA